jgi:hypothetical protein
VRTIKLFAVIGLAVALMGVWAAQAQLAKCDPEGFTVTGQKPNIDIKPSSITCPIPSQWKLDNQTGADISVKLVKGPGDLGDLKTGQAVTVTKDQTKEKARAFNIPERTTPGVYEIEIDPAGTIVKVTINVRTPTLTEWGLIALAVLLAGGMGYMIYRRRPALRPAAP